MSESLARSRAFTSLPPEWPREVLPEIRRMLATSRRKLVVLDDDPTGTQTVCDIIVVTRWDVATLRAELKGTAAGFYVLTNSRSLPPVAARALNVEVARNLREAAESDCPCTIVSRSDSTLRGHFPLETDTLADVLGPFDATLLAPYFEAGGRFTLGNVHYVAAGGALVPAAETPFARDGAFSYRSSNLCTWVEEKTAGRVRASDVQVLPLQLIRGGGPDAVLQALQSFPRGAYVVANAAAPRDIEVVALATLLAEEQGRRLLFRTAASFVAARLGIAPGPVLDPRALDAGDRRSGGLIVVGSHVPRTTEQLVRLREVHALTAIELHVEDVLNASELPGVIRAISRRANRALAAGEDVVLSTSRRLVTGPDAQAGLEISERVSRALVGIVQDLRVRPRFFVAKGGITASDIATGGLGVRRALVRGQLLPGVPVWRLGDEARFPGVDYVVFPGNVGEIDGLATAVTLLRSAARTQRQSRG